MKAGEGFEFPFPTQIENESDNVDGVKWKVTIQDKEYAVLLHFYPVGATYPTVVPLQAAVAPEPAAMVTTPGGAKETVEEWMQGMTHQDLALEARRVREYGFADANALQVATVEDIDDMLTSTKLGWTPCNSASSSASGKR